MRIPASWCDPHTDRPNTRLWRDFCAPMASSPLGSVVPIFRPQDYLCLVKGEVSTIAIYSGLEQRRMTFVRRGDYYDSPDCAFAVKPRAFGAPQAALGLDRSAQPSKRALHAANAIW